MNNERLIKIIEDLQECIGDIDECMEVLKNEKDNKLIIKLAKSSLRQLFVSYHTILEDFCSIILKEIKKYKIGISLSDAFDILKAKDIIDEDLYKCLNKSRLIRNRISHRYKEPSHEELLNHIKTYRPELEKIVTIAKRYLQ